MPWDCLKLTFVNFLLIFSIDKEEEKRKKEPGLFDFLSEDLNHKTDKPKPKSRGERSMDRQQPLKKSVSQDSITEELGSDTHLSVLHLIKK